MEFSNPILIVGIVLLTTLLVTAILVKLIPYLHKKGYDVGGIIKTADNVLDKASAVIDVTENILPPNPVLAVIQVIEKWAKIGVDSAEQMYIASTLEKEERKTSAKNQVYTVLSLLGIEVTEDIETIIEGAIEAEVMALGHSTEK